MNMQYLKEKKCHSDYRKFEWKIKASQIKARDGNKCQICGKDKNLNVHHVLYHNGWRLWDYPGNYLITLCEFHHGIEHACLKIIDIRKYRLHLLNGILAQDILL